MSVDISNGRAVGVSTAGRSYRADVTILAAGAWTSLIEIAGHPALMPVRPMRGQMIALSSKQHLIERVIYGPDCYLVPRADGRILVGATVEDAGYSKELTESAGDDLFRCAAAIVPEAANLEIVEKWSGLRPFAADGLPMLGPVKETEGLYIATGHFRNGILLAPITAKIIADKIVNGTASKYFEAFRPGRFEQKAASSID
jgi:glycine oxidase